MPAYLQMGHQCTKLLLEPELEQFRGLILSPVNEDPESATAQVGTVRARRQFDVVFDPQLYVPTSERGHLREWSYFPNDVDTADVGSDDWWQRVVGAMTDAARALQPDAVCSPAVVPRDFTDDYFAQTVRIGSMTAAALARTGLRPVQTAVVGLAGLSTPSRALAIASVLSATPCQEIYLVLVGTTDPRRELNHPEELKGAMRLIHALEREAKMPLIVGFTSSDAVLWKAAGASSVATGKFFNLRRFTTSRFEEPGGGGGQLAYWFEESLFAFLRESDVVRVRAQDKFSAASHANPVAQQILSRLDTAPGEAWVGLGWRQFLYWFADFERRAARGEIDIRAMLREAEVNWLALEDADVFMEEQRNNGVWLRAWRRALAEYMKH